ncbi:MAG: hypothetical protein MUC36_27000 [Planctomycetes bacterium]|nr:hypothetical protein [Planctomycetota bacterium]
MVTSPFLVLTPIGLRQRAEFAAALRQLGVRVRATEALVPWSEASSRLHRRGLQAAAIVRAARFEQRWLEVAPDDRAECWTLVDATDYRRLLAAKAALRQRFAGVSLGAAAAGEPQFALHAFHVPDPGDLAGESERLREFRGAGRVTGRQPVSTG